MSNCTLKIVAMTAACSIPLAAGAQDFFDLEAAPAATQAPKESSGATQDALENSANVGVRYQSQTSGYFGRYSGDIQRGPAVTGGFSLRSREDWKTGGTSYFALTGDNFDIGNNTYSPETAITLRVGDQGKWGITAGYNAITLTQSTEFMSPYGTDGNLNFATSPRVSPLGANSTLNPARVLDILHAETRYTMQTRRDIASLGGKVIANDWTVTGDYQHTHKTGLMEQSIRAGAAKAVFPQEISYEIDRFTTGASYATGPMQAQFGYAFSNFKDNNTYSAVQNFQSTTVYPDYAMYQQAPSNSSHMVYGNLALNLSPTTRLTAKIKNTVDLQDAPMGADINSKRVYPDQSINALADSVFANVQLTSRPFSRVDMKGSYTFDMREDMTNDRNAMGIASAVDDKGSAQKAGPQYSLTNPALSGLPLSWIKQTAKVEANYRVLDHTILSLGDTFSDVTRTSTLMVSTRENETWGSVKTTLAEGLDTTLRYGHSVRTAHVTNHLNSLGKLNGYTFAAAPWYQNARIQDALRLRMNYQPMDQVQVGVNGKGAYNVYPGQFKGYGMQRDYNVTMGPDVTWEARKGLSLHLFYEFQRDFTDAQSQTSTTPLIRAAITELTTADTNTLGAGIDWKASDDLSIGSDYLFQKGQTSIDVFNNISGPCAVGATGSPSVACALPIVNSTMQSFKLHAAYEIIPGVNLWAGYGLDILQTGDFLYGTDPYTWDTKANTFQSTESAPWYFVHTVGTKLTFRW